MISPRKKKQVSPLQQVVVPLAQTKNKLSVKTTAGSSRTFNDVNTVRSHHDSSPLSQQSSSGSPVDRMSQLKSMQRAGTLKSSRSLTAHAVRVCRRVVLCRPVSPSWPSDSTLWFSVLLLHHQNTKERRQRGKWGRFRSAVRTCLLRPGSSWFAWWFAAWILFLILLRYGSYCLVVWLSGCLSVCECVCVRLATCCVVVDVAACAHACHSTAAMVLETIPDLGVPIRAWYAVLQLRCSSLHAAFMPPSRCALAAHCTLCICVGVMVMVVCVVVVVEAGTLWSTSPLPSSPSRSFCACSPPSTAASSGSSP